LLEGMPTFFYTDCKHNDGIDEIVDFLKKRATSCQEFEVDMLAQPEEQAYEIIREKLYRTLHKEVPHHVNQVNRAFQQVIDPKTGEPGLLISQILIVQSKSHLQLLKGRNLSVILETAQRDLVKNFQCPVELQLSVKLAKSSERTWSI
jgi:GTPase